MNALERAPQLELAGSSCGAQVVQHKKFEITSGLEDLRVRRA